MKAKLRTIVLCILTSNSYLNITHAEIADAVYRDHLEFAGLNVNWHVALTYRYDNSTKTRYVIQAEQDGVWADNWNSFLGNTGGTIQKQACPENETKYETKDRPNHQRVRSIVASAFRKRSRTGGAPADDQVGCLITGNAADLPGCPPPPGMELN
jgi:hypothetical protein